MSLLFVVWAGILSAGEYFLSPQGNDGTGDGSRDRPWKTLPKALSSVPDDGSEILVRDGLYVGGNSLVRTFANPRGKQPNLGCYQGRKSVGNPPHARDQGNGVRF